MKGLKRAIAATAFAILSAALLAKCAAPGPPSVKAADGNAANSVLAALATEAPTARVRLLFERRGETQVYTIERVKAANAGASLHLIRNPGPEQQELIAVGGIQWLRTPTGWERTPVTSSAVFDTVAQNLFSHGLSDVVEHESIGTGTQRKRRFSSRIAWANGGTKNSGALALAIDSRGRPSSLAFDGHCGGDACRFRELFDYEAKFVIAAP